MADTNERRNLERFGALVLADDALHDQLRAAASEADFVALAVRLGSERGCVFLPVTVTAAIREQRRAWQERWL